MTEALRSRDNPRVRAWRRLRDDARERRSRRRALIEGVHLVEAYFERVGAPRELIVSQGALANAEVAALARRSARAPVMVSGAVFDAIADTEHPVGIAAEIDLPEGDAGLAGAKHCVLIEGVQDAGNLGAILRSAAAFGVDAVVVGAGSADPWSPKVLRAGMGAHFLLRVGESAGLERLARGFDGLRLCTVPRGGSALESLDLTGPVAWILGSEGAGVSAPLAAQADARVRIAMAAGTESLNVAAAAAICFYERTRQLSTSAARS